MFLLYEPSVGGERGRGAGDKKEDFEKVILGIFKVVVGFEKQEGQESVSLCDKSKYAFRKAKLL